MNITKEIKKQIQAERDYLKKLIKPSSQLLIIIKSVSSSGMSRRMRVIVNHKGRFVDVTYSIGKLCDISVNDTGLKIGGCGMDMTFWLADYITTCLYGKNKPKGLKGNGGGCLSWFSI